MMWLIPLIGIPLLLTIVGVFMWLSMERDEKAKLQRRELRQHNQQLRDEFRADLCQELGAATQRLVSAHPNQPFRGFAVCLDDDIASFYLAATNRPEPTGKKSASFKNSAGELIEVSGELYDITHWNCETDLRGLEPSFRTLSDMSRKDRLDCFGNALLDFKNNGGFSFVPHDDELFLAVWIHDSDDGEWLIEWAKKLNDKEAAWKFAVSNFGPNSV